MIDAPVKAIARRGMSTAAQHSQDAGRCLRSCLMSSAKRFHVLWLTQWRRCWLGCENCLTVYSGVRPCILVGIFAVGWCIARRNCLITQNILICHTSAGIFDSASVSCQNAKQQSPVKVLCNPLALQPEQSGGVGLKPGRAPPLERHDKGSWTRLALSYFCDPSAWR